ncbi:uncharacterized protein LOC110732033 isoform X2 [Chenopodium quinoa]|uniref:uncharacterized protein LOC110732033 isoform X2 n=1 Tax=Chenopodium quinoa TaxID=63459 RepID=UPI000B770485|nr:uncharacterized protein LOC110732033 isoform X2 [Chenopodium quinoa]
MYLDMHNIVPLRRGVFPRINVWNMQEIGLVVRLDRHSADGDFGKMGMIDVDMERVIPRRLGIAMPNEEIPFIFKPPKVRRIRCATNPCFVRNPLPAESILYMEVSMFNSNKDSCSADMNLFILLCVCVVLKDGNGSDMYWIRLDPDPNMFLPPGSISDLDPSGMEKEDPYPYPLEPTDTDPKQILHIVPIF